MSPEISDILIPLIAGLVILLVISFIMKRMNVSGSDPWTQKNWPITAKQLGVIVDSQQPVGKIEKEEFSNHTDGVGYNLIMNPTNVQDRVMYSGKGPRIRSFTGSKRVIEINDEENNRIIYKVILKLPVDNLYKGYSWEKEKCLAKDIDHCPIGISQELETVTYSLAKSGILIGGTGAGKGSVIWSLVGSACHMQNVEFYGIDLKSGKELKTNRSLFAGTATDKDSLLDLVHRIWIEMKERQREYDRSYTFTKEVPRIVLIVDEVNSIPRIASRLSKDEKDQFDMEWTELLAQGRSDGVSIFAAGQNPRVKAIPYREGFTQSILLRTADKGDQDIFLPGYSDKVNVFNYLLPTEKNPERAGRGFLLDADTHEFREFKAFYPTDEQIKSWKSAREGLPSSIDFTHSFKESELKEVSPISREEATEMEEEEKKRKKQKEEK